MSKSHSNAPAIVVGDWATGRYIADAIKVADPSFVSGKIMRELVNKYGLNKRDLVRKNRNERNDGYGRYAFYHVPTIKLWCKDAGRDFDTPEKNGISEIDMQIISHGNAFVMWMVRHENDAAHRIFEKYLDHFSSIIENNYPKGN